MTMLAAAVLGQQGAPVAAFDLETDIAWHSLFWAEGSAFTAEGYANGDPVPTWPNETAEADLTQGTPANQPLYVSSGIGGRPAVDLVDTTDAMSATLAVAEPQPVTMVLLCSIDNPNQNADVLSGSDASRSRLRVLSTGGGSMILRAGSANVGLTAVSASTPYLFVGVFDGASSRLIVNGTASATGNPGTGGLPAALKLGDGGVAGVYSLMAIYDGDLTADGSYAAFKTWVASHYGLTIA